MISLIIHKFILKKKGKIMVSNMLQVSEHCQYMVHALHLVGTGIHVLLVILTRKAARRQAVSFLCYFLKCIK